MHSGGDLNELPGWQIKNKRYCNECTTMRIKQSLFTLFLSLSVSYSALAHSRKSPLHYLGCVYGPFPHRGFDFLQIRIFTVPFRECLLVFVPHSRDWLLLTDSLDPQKPPEYVKFKYKLGEEEETVTERRGQVTNVSPVQSPCNMHKMPLVGAIFIFGRPFLCYVGLWLCVSSSTRLFLDWMSVWTAA